MNPLKRLHEYGQSVWMDFLDRQFVGNGSFKRLVDEDGVSGVTSNPTIFRKAIISGSEYDSSLNSTIAGSDCDAMRLYEHVAIEDIRSAADILLPVYRSTGGADGFVSLEVSPYLANDTDGTVAEARRLWNEVARPNVMIKVPGTEAGVPAIRQLLGEGININITLLFARHVYRQVAEAYIAALEQLTAAGGDARRLASVASFFVSRIDTAVDKLIDAKIKQRPDQKLADLRGRIAVANAKLAYQDYKQLFSGSRWDALQQRGARVQRLLWASTSTKNPAYRDVMYVEDLIGPDTINTMPIETIEAFRDHGKVANTIEADIPAAQQQLNLLEKFGISLNEVTDKLTVEGVKSFAESFDGLLAGVEQRRAQTLGAALNRYSASLDKATAEAVQNTLEEWTKAGKIRDLWGKDANLWTGTDEDKWLGWLNAVDDSRAQIQKIDALASGLQKDGITNAVLLGMGGSSLGAEVFARTFGARKQWPVLHVLDSTHPQAIREVEGKIDLAKAAFIVSSKSGTTLEPNILMDYFWDRVEKVKKGAAAPRFVAITDPGSQLERVAKERHFRHVFSGNPAIGGRYSVLSVFGLVPAAISGVDVSRLLESAAKMVRSCDRHVPPEQNPGVLLGVALGTLAKSGRDKVTIIASPRIADFGAWLEQLLAESTGKQGKGLIPIDAEPLTSPDGYGRDRLFAYLRLDRESDVDQDNAVAALEKAGQPVLRFAIADPYDIGQEFFRWEMATAIAGGVIGINPFDQPDVEASKVKTRALMKDAAKAAPETPLFAEDGIRLYGGGPAMGMLNSRGNSLSGVLKQFFAATKPGDYCALLAYLNPNSTVKSTLQQIRVNIRDRKKIATCAEIGPRFLHSTGQAYKGGPNTGAFLQITSDYEPDLPVPGQSYTFGKVIEATARGDFEVLNERSRRALHIHLAGDGSSGLMKLEQAISDALAQG
ncbi:MAG TPA: bifunctional transaldolase/phosoglucose isomerase [Micropepsaceae bacterium]|nr:bifunctional transaldolase/phosoglucose isomerase [Micropepsaceae bacterium]